MVLPDFLNNILPTNFHFATSSWLYGLIALPVLWLLYMLFYRGQNRPEVKLKGFADPHLLPHLLGEKEQKSHKQNLWQPLLLWSVIWICALFAMAGPRWNYTEVKAFTPAHNLVIVLDISRSMDAGDIKPSRLIRARQEIEDLIRNSEGMKFGLVAFDAVPHMITPLTDDMQTLKQTLPSLTTDIAYIQGSTLAPALNMSADMLASESGESKYILILSDGGFDDGDATLLTTQQNLRHKGIEVHAIGLGTIEGAPVPDGRGGFFKDAGKTFISKLEENQLKLITSDRGGLYQHASYLDDDTRAVLSRIKGLGSAEKEEQKTALFWEERFYLFLLPILLLVLPWFRRNARFPAVIVVLCVMQLTPTHAFEWRNLFLNNQQQGKAALEQQQYDQATQKFNDAYRKGVAQYEAGNYADAIQFFESAQRPEIQSEAHYNLGNAQLMSGQVEQAIETYETLLKDSPDHEDARHNLEIARGLLEQQKGQQNNDQNQQQQNSQDQQSQEQSSSNSNQDASEQDKQNQREGQDQEQADAKKGSKEQEDKRSNQNSEEQKREEQEASGSKNDEDKSEQEEQESSYQENKENQEEQSAEETEGQHSTQNTDDNLEGSPVQTPPRTQIDINADQWLNRVDSNPEEFLRNKFYIESQLLGAEEGENPW